MRTPFAAPIPRVARSRRDDRYQTGRQPGPKRASAGWVVSVQDDTVTVMVLGEELTGVIPLGEVPPVGAICEVESRRDLLVIPIWYEGPPPLEWVQDPDFTVMTQTPRATLPTLEFYESNSVGTQTLAPTGDTVANFNRAVLAINGDIETAWDATAVIPEDDFLLAPTGGTPTFPPTADSTHSWEVRFQCATGDPFDGMWDNSTTAIHTGHAVETRCPNLIEYVDGPTVQWESPHARVVAATINVTMTYGYDSHPLGATDATIAGTDALLKVYVYRFSANNNLMIAPKAKRLIHTDGMPRTVSAGGVGPSVVTMDVVLDETELADWAYGNGVMFYSHLSDPQAPAVSHLETHFPVLAVSYASRIEINMDASTWTVRPPRWRAIP